MKIREDRSHMNIDTRWFEKGYIKGAVLVNSRCRVSVYGDINFELTSGDFVKDE